MKLDYKPSITNIATTSGASRNKKVYSFNNALVIKHKKLFKIKSWKSGRSKAGSIVTLSKGRRLLKSRVSQLNRSYRDTSISFISCFVPNPYSKTLSSIVFSGSGSITAIPASNIHKVLSLTFLKTVFHSTSILFQSILSLKRDLIIQSNFYLVLQLPRHSHVSNLEVTPCAGSSVARSSGTSCKLMKMDPRTGLSLLKLPSGVKKIVSIFSVGSFGKSALSNSKKINVTSASSSVKLGKAPRSRGVAKNPVDHPHGGRTKAIRYPRTPWGKTTKFK